MPLSHTQTDHLDASTTTAPSHAPSRKLTATLHPFHQHSLTLFRRSNALLKDYNTVNRLIKSNKEKLKIGKNWQADVEQLTKVLEAGKRYAMEQMTKRIGIDEKDAKGKENVDEGTMKEHENDEILVKEVEKGEGIWSLLCEEATADAGESIERQSWVEAAGKMEKGVKRLTKYLPRETDREEQWA